MELRLIFLNKKFWLVTLVLLILSMVLFANFKRTDVDTSFSYEQFIENIYKSHQRMEISIFKNNTDNLQKSEMIAEAYQHVKNIKVSEGDYGTAGAVVSFDTTKVILLIFAVVFVWIFIETNRGKSPLLFTLPRGRTYLAGQRIITIVLSSFIFIGIWFTGIFLISLIRNGTDSSYFVPVQSVYELYKCIFKISIWQYFILEFVLLVIGLAVTIELVWLIKKLVSGNIAAVVVLAVIYVVEYLLLGIEEQSSYVTLKYINLWNLISPYEVISSYRVLSVGNWLCGSMESFFIFLIGCFFVIPIAIVVVENKRLGGVRLRLGSPRVIKKIFLHIFSKLNLFGLECYKILFEQKGLVSVVTIVVVLFMMLDTGSVMYYGVNEWKNSVYEEYSGTDLSRIEEYVSQEQERIAQIDAEYNNAQTLYENGKITVDELNSYITKLSMIETEREGLEDIQSQLSSLRNSKEDGINVFFMDNKAYVSLWKSNSNYVSRTDTNRRIYGFLAVASVIFFAGFLFSYEKDMKLEKLIRPLSGSRQKLFGLRHFMLFMSCVIACGLIYGFELYEIYKVYDLKYLCAPVQSLIFLSEFSLRIPIWAYLVIIEFFRLAALYEIGWITVFVGSRLGSVRGMVVALLFLGGPEILNMVSNLDLHWLSAVQIVMATERISRYNMGFYISSFGVLGLIAMYCYCKVEESSL